MTGTTNIVPESRASYMPQKESRCTGGVINWKLCVLGVRGTKQTILHMHVAI